LKKDWIKMSTCFNVTVPYRLRLTNFTVFGTQNWTNCKRETCRVHVNLNRRHPFKTGNEEIYGKIFKETDFVKVKGIFVDVSKDRTIILEPNLPYIWEISAPKNTNIHWGVFKMWYKEETEFTDPRVPVWWSYWSRSYITGFTIEEGSLGIHFNVERFDESAEPPEIYKKPENMRSRAEILRDIKAGHNKTVVPPEMTPLEPTRIGLWIRNLAFILIGGVSFLVVFSIGLFCFGVNRTVYFWVLFRKLKKAAAKIKFEKQDKVRARLGKPMLV